MLHEPVVQLGKDNAADYKMRLGMVMFICYGLFYAGFVVINLIKPVLMEKEIVFGLNLATVYGFALIIVALVMALIYNTMCNRQELALNRDEPKEEGE
jgi:uncharacterized membrane protein (DUF485 family)